jgi:hypothetical protein
MSPPAGMLSEEIVSVIIAVIRGDFRFGKSYHKPEFG